MSGSKTVLVTGTSGFIAQHIVDNLLSKGYRVIGTTRSESKNTFLRKEYRCRYENCQLEFEVVSDISVDKAFDKIFINHPEIQNVIHTASPFFYGSEKPLDEAYLVPALKGTLNILLAITQFAPQVTNVVITSSFAAMKQMDETYTTHVHNNETWNPIKWEEVKTENDAYVASKTYAEKAAREFLRENNPNFSLATVNPPYVFGPQCFDSSVGLVLNTSNEILNTVTKLDPSLRSPQVMFGALAIDVRDVAEFHVKALEIPALASERIFIAAEPITAQKVLDVLNNCCPTFSGKIARGDPSQTANLLEKYCPKYDLTHTLRLIGDYKFITLQQSLTDVYSQYFKVNTYQIDDRIRNDSRF